MKIAIAGVGTALACTAAFAQTMNGYGAPSPATQSVNDPYQNALPAATDSDFLKSAARANMGEVSAAKLALSKSSNDQVKQFAQKMIDDHTAMEQQVQQIASSLKVTLPTEPSKADKAEAAKLQALSGPEFDKAYINAQVKDHKKVLAEMKQQNLSTQNPQVKELTGQGSQTVQEHLNMAQKLQSQLG
jgi:putative membrane protein